MFKKSIFLVLMVAILMTVVAVPTLASGGVYDYLKIVKLAIGEKNAEINYAPATMDQAAFVKNGRTLVPFRFLGEALGAQISWDSAKNQASLKLNTTEVKVSIGSKAAYINGKLFTLDVPAESKGGRTFIPLRFVSEALGATVGYDEATATVSVSYVDSSKWTDYKDSKTNEVLFRYPTDWKVATEQDGAVTVFTSPLGSEVSIFGLNLTMTEAVENLKKSAPEQGFKFDSEVNYDNSDPKAGKVLTFINKDLTNSENDIYEYIYILRQSGTQDVLIIDETMGGPNIEVDDPIMMEIAFE